MADLTFPLGDALAGIEYELLGWEDPPGDLRVDEVAMAVTLHWHTSPSTRISWSTDAEREGLVQGGLGGQSPGPEPEIVDVSERWAALIGQRLTACTFSHSVPSGGLPWAMNLQFALGAHLIVALGELLDDKPTYIPDSLLVTGSREIAMAFCPRQRSERLGAITVSSFARYPRAWLPAS